MQPLIINAAVTGGVPTKDQNRNLPYNPEEIGMSAVECWREGASVVHIHARTDDGSPTFRKEYFQRILDVIHAEDCDVVINFSTAWAGGSAKTWEERMEPLALHPEIGSYDAGSLNVGAGVFDNTHPFLEALATRMNELRVKPEIEIFDVGMLGTVNRLVADGHLSADPLFIQFILGLGASAPGTPKQLMHMVEMLPPNAVWSVGAVGAAQLPMNTLAIVLGGHARTGMEDNLRFRRGVDASNPMLVERVRTIADIHNRPIATPTQARDMLGLRQLRKG